LISIFDHLKECGGDVAKTFIMQVKCKDRFSVKTTCEANAEQRVHRM